MPTKTLKRRLPKLDIRAVVMNWLQKDDTIKALGAMKEEERQIMLEFLQQHGEQDQSGHFWINWPEDPVGGRIKGIKAEKRVSRMLDQEAAEEFLKGKRLYSQCTETITVLSEEKILGLAFAKKITDDELEALYAVSETYAFVPQRVKL